MTSPKPSPDGLFNRILAVSRPAVRNRHALEHNSIYILFKSTFTMKHILSTMMALCCIVGLGRAQLSPLSSAGYSTEAPLGYWLELKLSQATLVVSSKDFVTTKKLLVIE